MIWLGNLIIGLTFHWLKYTKKRKVQLDCMQGWKLTFFDNILTSSWPNFSIYLSKQFFSPSMSKKIIQFKWQFFSLDILWGQKQPKSSSSISLSSFLRSFLDCLLTCRRAYIPDVQFEVCWWSFSYYRYSRFVIRISRI